LSQGFECGGFLFGRGSSRRTFAKCTAQSAAHYAARSRAPETGFKIFAACAALSCEDGEASLLTFESGLCNFDGRFNGGTHARAGCDAATEALSSGLGGFGSGTTEDTGRTKRGNVSGAFKGSLNGSGTRSSAGAGDVPALLDLALDVGAKELRKCSSSAATNTADDGTG
jgi:hypothetical protein